MTRRRAAERLFTPAFIALGVADLCYFTGFGIVIFALPLYVTGPVGGGEALAGWPSARSPCRRSCCGHSSGDRPTSTAAGPSSSAELSWQP
jgi:hypothetical protein